MKKESTLIRINSKLRTLLKRQAAREVIPMQRLCERIAVGYLRQTRNYPEELKEFDEEYPETIL